MPLVEVLGHFAAICTTISFVPQAIKVVRSRDTKSLSLTMYLLFSIGIAGWLAYGILINRPPLIFANIVTLALALTILWMKMTENRRKENF